MSTAVSALSRKISSCAIKLLGEYFPQNVHLQARQTPMYSRAAKAERLTTSARNMFSTVANSKADSQRSDRRPSVFDRWMPCGCFEYTQSCWIRSPSPRGDRDSLAPT